MSDLILNKDNSEAAAATPHVALPCDCQHCGATDMSQHSLVCPARLSDEYVQKLRAKSAPIAPAAEELIFKAGFKAGSKYICEHLNDEQVEFLSDSEWYQFKKEKK